MRRSLLALSAIVSLALTPACGDDSESEKEKNDAGITPDIIVRIDTGTTQDPDGGVPQQDTGVIPAGLTCIQILQCIQTNCAQPTEECVNDCREQGTTAALADYSALETCFNQAGQGTGTCSAPCVTPASADCQRCLKEACATQLDTCMGTGGPVVEGFGASCDPQAQNCAGDMTCLGLEGYDGAFCSVSCDNMGYPCSGAPEGTFAACTLQITGGGFDGNYCAFLCKLQNGTEYACPTGLICDPVGTQGQHFCMPPAAQ